MLSILLSIHWADSVTFKVIWMKNATLVTVLFFFWNAQLLGCKMVLITGIFSPFYTCKLLPHLNYFFLIFPYFNYNHNLLLFNKVIWKLFCIRLVLNSPFVIEGEMCESKTGRMFSFLYSICCKLGHHFYGDQNLLVFHYILVIPLKKPYITYIS